MHPEAKAECIAILTHQLELFAENDYDLNALLIYALKVLKVPEAMPLIKEAYEADRVDEFFAGSLDDVEVAFGLKEAAETPHRGLNIEEWRSASIQPPKKPRTHGNGGFNKNKAKNKLAKQSRKRNRRRK